MNIRNTIQKLYKSNANALDTKNIIVKHDQINSQQIKYIRDEFASTKYNIPDIPHYLDRCNMKTTIHLGTIKIEMMYANIAANHLTTNQLTTNQLNTNQLINQLIKVIKRLYILTQIYAITKDIHYIFLPIDNARKFPESGKLVTPININGAYTYPRHNEVFIYRLEDYAKVMIHELLHHTIIESQTVWTPAQINNLKHAFNISKSSEFLPNEALVEVWATIYQLTFLSVEYNVPFSWFYERECDWARSQTSRLLYHQKTLNKEAIWTEKTNAFTYIVLKTIFLLNLGKFLEIHLPYNTPELYNFILEHKNIEKNQNIDKFKNTKMNNYKKSMRISLFGDL